MSVEKQTLSALKWASLAKLVGQVLSWAVTLIVLRLLLPSDYGLSAIITVIITVLSSVAELGLGASLVQAPKLDKDDLAAVTGVVIVFNLAIGLLVCLTAPVAAWFYSEPRLTLLIEVAALHFLFNALGTIPQSLAYREMNFRLLSIIELLSVVSSGLVTLGLAWHGAGVWALLIGSLLQNGVRTTLLLYRPGLPAPIFRREGLRHHVTFGGLITVIRMASQFVYQADIVIAGRLFTSQALGLYSVSLHLATLPMQKIMSVINQVAFPAVSRMQHDRERLRVRILEATRMLMAFSVAALWGLSSVAPEFVRVVMGEKWLGAVYPLQAVCVVVPLRMLSAVYGTAALGLGNILVQYKIIAVCAVILPTAFFIGGYYWGVNGLASGWVVAIPLMFVINLGDLMKVLGIKVADLIVFVRAPVVAGVAMYVAVGLMRWLVIGFLPDIPRLIALIVGGGVAYIAALWLMDRRIIGELRRMVSG